MSFVTRELSGSSSQVEAVLAAPTPSIPHAFYNDAFKRLFDLFVVIFTAPIWLPLVLLGASLTALDGHSPVYRQARVGLDGKTFQILKLRTMVVDADAVLKRYLSDDPAARAEWDAHQKLRHDPRITPVGRILRKTSLDELPQLLNVIIGDMSLVGPRPMMVCQKELYEGEHYYELRPGLTGLWQVSQRHNSQFSDRVRFDNVYAANVSFGLDLQVLFRTVGVVLRGTGC